LNDNGSLVLAKADQAHQAGLVLATGIYGTRQLGTVRLFAALDLDELADQVPGTTVGQIHHGLLLGLQAKPAAALPVGADAIVGDEAAGNMAGQQ